MKERTIKALTESVSVRRQTEERIKAEKRAEAAAAMVAECERDHPPEPEYLAWQAAGKPDAGEVSRLREVVGKLMDRCAECERDHPPEPEYLAWQAAGKPDAGEVSRLREELDEYKTKWAPIIREYLEPKR
jgi:hypothetical protein